MKGRASNKKKKRLFEKVDIYGNKPQFVFTADEKSLTTNLGGVISIFTITIFVSYIYLQLSNVF
jgi:hypothetical protein